MAAAAFSCVITSGAGAGVGAGISSISVISSISPFGSTVEVTVVITFLPSG
eukprot:CAMPEP_0116015540 /NCGR_PEP_ID=MMETSP0321-20121206/6909_1 /TAXON_ID=163516 /ORGANISM="Leptocylindrus danicus var. danicus, Strain B650" /LENGTH=50 /DNA_ID=CAMNT_0003485353 /DNA_START=643 /DNA_END=795 /DNA_ORIENTATION=-